MPETRYGSVPTEPPHASYAFTYDASGNVETESDWV